MPLRENKKDIPREDTPLKGGPKKDILSSVPRHWKSLSAAVGILAVTGMVVSYNRASTEETASPTVLATAPLDEMTTAFAETLSNKESSTSSSEAKGSAKGGKVPYLTTITRNSVSAPKKSLWGDIPPPYPTHAFWENFVIGTGVDGNNVVTTLPYLAQATSSSVDLFYPYTNMATKTQYQLGFDQVVGRLSIGAQTGEDGGHVIDSFTDLGVTLKFDFEKDGVMKTHVVQGSPYVSYEYKEATPLITSGQILRRYLVNNVESKCSDNTIKGEIFEFSLLQFDETWRVYAFPAIEFVCTASNPPMALQAAKPYTGVLRVALSNNCTFGQSAHHCKGDGKGGYITSHPKGYGDYLYKHSSAMVTGGSVNYSFSGSTAKVNFNWDVKQLGEKAVEPLMMTMPHHRDIMDSSFEGMADLSVASHKSIHGIQRLAVGSQWPCIEQLSDIMWHAPRDVEDEEQKDAILKALKTDLKYDLPWNYQTGTGDPYNAGKMLAKIANIVLVGEAMGLSTKKMKPILNSLQSGIEFWLNGTSRNALVYDKSWGGIVSCGCKYAYPPPRCLNGGPPSCPALGGDPVSNGFDFGNGAYNDHHFHYGYMTYAAATLAHFRPSWGKQWYDAAMGLVRDIANPSYDDQYFPKFRHTDWYAGHSWAGGVAMAYLNGRNQESVSEAFNAWYAVALWGDATGDNEMRDIGRLLAAMEARAARTYWQIPHFKSEIYPEEFSIHHTAGIIWSNLIQYQTWFGMLQWEVQGIQTLPVTPASEMVFNATWAEKAADIFEKTCSGSCHTDGWITFLCMLQAVGDKSNAWDCATGLPSSVFSGEAAGGNGNSLSNTLYWIATRP
eukprot:CAMPEP_0184503066 /NCGR_PEP_ID=MMETSP0113_2-20130426/51615_1 /TAXON_ID=91329 /ORGANISM="Norrisiella sphaerica, Strain BC52" /LENGTH=838 /DNA_ID=CAMNT_0026892479 /DNA_START=79 /DNA_END=2595 /DNA_ORIENTATION=-